MVENLNATSFSAELLSSACHHDNKSACNLLMTSLCILHFAGRNS